MTRQWDVVVIGAGGSQAQAMLRAAARAGVNTRWLAVDRKWRPEARAATQKLGFQCVETDPLADPEALRALLASGNLVANLAGPYYRTGLTVLDCAIATGTQYLDICDDADATLLMLERDADAKAAGILALIGMGSSPGTTNILIHAAVDYLGPRHDVDIYWSVDTADLTDAAVRHFWHCFNLVEPNGTVHRVPGWEQLERRVIEFPQPVGKQTTVRLAHPEPITVPRVLPVGTVSNFGAIAPLEAFYVAWSLALIADPQAEVEGSAEATDKAVQLFMRYRDRESRGPRTGSGMIIDVHRNGTGLRFAAGSDSGMDDSTGIPAAAGALMMSEGLLKQRGVVSPEVLPPVDFFNSLRRVSDGGGGLALNRLVNGTVGERMRIRDLLAAATPQRAVS
jgi:saccharopine dehydrogenase-like NADP-dependent oxidoreductase